MFGSAPSDVPLVGPLARTCTKGQNRSNAAFSRSFDRQFWPCVAETHLCGEKRTISMCDKKYFRKQKAPLPIIRLHEIHPAVLV
jgi:hypothetical protein